MGCLSALGMNIDECMDNMFNSVRNINFPQRFTSNHDIKYPVFEIEIGRASCREIVGLYV